MHVVQRGENLFRIALKYNRFAEDIAEANGITNSDARYPSVNALIIPLPAGFTTATYHARRCFRRDTRQYRRNLWQKPGGAHIAKPAGLGRSHLCWPGTDYRRQVMTKTASELSDDTPSSAPTDGQVAPVPTAVPSQRNPSFVFTFW